MGLDSRDYYRPSRMSGFTFFPPIIKALLIINITVFLLQMIARSIFIDRPITLDDIIIRYFALIPIDGLIQGDFQIVFYPWQLITYQFMHNDFTHILLNMFFLWMFGMEIENIMGSRKFLFFYLACGLGAGLVQLLLAPLFEPIGLTIGASGAVYGVMIAFAMYFPDRFIYVYFLIPVKAKYLIAFLVIIEFLSVGNQSIVAHFAHIGGAVTGFLFIMYDRRNRYNTSNIFSSFNKSGSSFSSSSFRNAFKSKTSKAKDIEDANFYDINESKKNNDIVNQEEIDKILDKISQSGYQNLTEHEKKILFEASKKK